MRIPPVPIYRVSLAVIGLAQFLDVWTTDRALAAGNSMEANPVARFLMDYLGSAWCAPKYLLGALAIVIAFQTSGKSVKPVTAGVAMLVAKLYLFVLVSNYFGIL